MKAPTLVLVLLSAAPGIAQPGVAEKLILGDWCAGSDTAFHEEFTLDIEDGVRTFSSWLHHRPAESGTWELNGRSLTIREQSGGVHVYTIVSATSKRLVVRSARGAREVYVRKGCREFRGPDAEG